MMNKSISINSRLWLSLLLSALGAAVTMAVLGYIIETVYWRVPLPAEVNSLIVRVYINYGYWKSFFLGTAVITILYFFLWLKRKLAYFHLIFQSIQKLSEGQFDLDLPVKNNDPLGDMAHNLNQVKGQLEALIEEEKRAIRSKNELVTNVSHDLRTPLTSIIGYLRLIEEDKYRDEVELRYYVDVAYEKAKRLNGMVNDLFEFTKINNREMALKRVQFNLIELLRQLAAQFTPQLSDAGMEIELKTAADNCMIEADPDKMMRVFENLISNAIKYGKEGKKVDLLVEEKDQWAIVKVVNYGEPIPEKAIPFIFERMYRVEQSRSDETGGTGLGLAIAKGIVEMHQGEILVKSNEAETIFEVQLPFS